jgi:hypothetical protein
LAAAALILAKELLMSLSAPLRRFSVHARQVDRHHARIVEENSFEAAAVAYVEDFHPPVEAGNELSVIVRDLEDGHEHCFRIDLDTGETEPCG